MKNSVYTVDEIRAIAAPLARRYGVVGLYLFGSYARGEASAHSDIDLRLDRTGVKDLLSLGGLYSDLEARLGKPLDLMTTQMLSEDFMQRIREEEIPLYVRDP